MGLAPIRLTTGAQVKVTTLGAQDTQITLGQFLRAGITETLVKTPLAASSTMDAVDLTCVSQGHALTDQVVERHFIFADPQTVGNR